MTTLSRRTFLIGMSAAVASPFFIEKADFIGNTVPALIPPGLKWRKIKDITMSCMPTGLELADRNWVEDPVRYTFYRDDSAIYVITMNPRATYRWAAHEGSEIVVPETSTLRILVEPCYTYTTINMISDIEKSTAYTARRRTFSENYRWRDGKIEIQEFSALHPQDAYVLEDA